MEDIELVSRVLKGEIESFDQLIIKYELSIMRLIYSIVGDRETAEDICQEVFISAYNKLYTFKQKYKFSTWLHQIAKNRAIDHIRRQKKIKQISIDYIENSPSSDDSPEKIVEYRELKKSIEDFILTLDERDKQILYLRYSNQSLTFTDIADILDLNQSTVKRRYYRIYDKYEQYMEGKLTLEERSDSYGL